jgi:hypothetical protein
MEASISTGSRDPITDVCFCFALAPRIAALQKPETAREQQRQRRQPMHQWETRHQQERKWGCTRTVGSEAHGGGRRPPGGGGGAASSTTISSSSSSPASPPSHSSALAEGGWRDRPSSSSAAIRANFRDRSIISPGERATGCGPVGASVLALSPTSTAARACRMPSASAGCPLILPPSPVPAEQTPSSGSLRPCTQSAGPHPQRAGPNGEVCFLLGLWLW